LVGKTNYTLFRLNILAKLKVRQCELLILNYYDIGLTFAKIIVLIGTSGQHISNKSYVFEKLQKIPMKM